LKLQIHILIKYRLWWLVTVPIRDGSYEDSVGHKRPPNILLVRSFTMVVPKSINIGISKVTVNEENNLSDMQ